MNQVTRVLGAVLLAGAPIAASGQGCLEEVGRWGYGPMKAIATSDEGGPVVFSSGLTLIAADFGDALAPAVAGELSLPGVIEDLEATGHLVLAAVGEAGLCVVDVSDPAAPRALATLATPGPALRVTRFGAGAVVVSQQADEPERFRLTLVDLSEPDHPRPLGACDAPGRPRSVAVSGHHALVATGSLEVIDLADPLHPSRAATLGEADVVAVADGVVLAIDNYYAVLPPMGGTLSWYTLTLLDAARLPQAAHLGSLRSNTYLQAGAVEVEGETAFIMTAHQVDLVDLSDPSTPVLLTSPGHVRYRFADLAARPGRAFLVDLDFGLRSLRVARPALAYFTAGLPRPTVWPYSDNIQVVSRHAYLHAYGGVWTFDLTEPTAPERGVVLSNDYARVAASGEVAGVLGDRGLFTYDLSSPGHPTVLGWCETRHSGLGLAFAERFLLAAGSQGSVQLFDISDPRRPVIMSSFDNPDLVQAGAILAWDVETVGSHALVAETHYRDSWYQEPYAGALRVLRFAEPEHLVQVNRVVLPEPARALAVSDGWAWVGTSASRVRVFDVSRPDQPVEVTTYELASPVRALTATPDHLFIVDAGGWVTALDVSDPLAPHELGTVDTRGDALGVAVADGYAWVPDDRAGLAGLGLEGCSTRTPAAEISWIPEEPVAGRPVQLLDRSLGLPTAWAWDLGDGTASAEQSPVHVYAAPGLYRVSLTATNPHGSSTTETLVPVGPQVRHAGGRFR